MRTATLTPVAILATEREYGWTDNTEQGVPVWRPIGVPRKNDGVRAYWMIEGETYGLRWDGLGWAVSNQLWDASHRYRLGTSDGTGYARSLLTTEGVDMELDNGREYVLRLIRGIGHTGWGGTYVTLVAELSEVN